MIILPAGENASLPPNPGEGALHQPAPRISAEPASILCCVRASPTFTSRSPVTVITNSVDAIPWTRYAQMELRLFLNPVTSR